MKLLSERINAILAENPDLNQAELARISGASRGMVNHWITGKVGSMDIEYALNIEERLAYNHVWLMLGRGIPRNYPMKNDSRINHILEVLQRVEDYQVDQVVKIVDVIASTSPTAPDPMA